MSATASGASKGNGDAKSRDHNQGNQDRKYTTEQKAAVIRVRRCSPTAFYDILGLESSRATATGGEIKKAYRKQSLLTHPDKNGHEHADEAFKMVSRAFGVLGDEDKRKQYDRFGGDPDSRSGGGSAPQSSPFSGFAQRAPPSGARGGWDDEISPEEMFNRFFGGAGFGGFGGGGGGMFDAGPQMFFNLNGGPGVRVHQFGGARPRMRTRTADARPAPEQSLRSTLIGLLPFLILFIIPLLSNLFSGEATTAAGPQFEFRPVPPYTQHRTTNSHHVNYFVNPRDVAEYTNRNYALLDTRVEQLHTRKLQASCDREVHLRQLLENEAQGWFFQDPVKMKEARSMEMKACGELEAMRRVPKGSL